MRDHSSYLNLSNGFFQDLGAPAPGTGDHWGPLGIGGGLCQEGPTGGALLGCADGGHLQTCALQLILWVFQWDFAMNWVIFKSFLAFSWLIYYIDIIDILILAGDCHKFLVNDM